VIYHGQSPKLFSFFKIYKYDICFFNIEGSLVLMCQKNFPQFIIYENQKSNCEQIPIKQTRCFKYRSNNILVSKGYGIYFLHYWNLGHNKYDPIMFSNHLFWSQIKNIGISVILFAIHVAYNTKLVWITWPIFHSSLKSVCYI
jgi:hypothetical protein